MVVGPGLVSTSPAFMRSIASHPAGPHDRLAQKTVIGPPLLGTGGVDTICQGLPDCCDSSTACRLCRLEPDNVCFNITSVDPPPSQMKHTLHTRHLLITEPLLVQGKVNETLKAMHTVAVNKSMDSKWNNHVQDD